MQQPLLETKVGVIKMSEKKKRIYDCIPVLIVLCILPFITYLHVYTEDMENYSWYGLDTELTDFFSYGKLVVFCFITTYMAGKLIWERLQGRWKMGKSKYTYLFSGAVFCFLISALCAEKKQLALWGGYQHFEGLFVLFGYLIVCMYTYYFVKDEESRILVLNGLAVTAFILCMIGFLQMAGKDPVFWEWVQKLIIPSSKEGVHLESRMRQRTVYLTLANANYASMYLSALIPVFWVWEIGRAHV